LCGRGLYEANHLGAPPGRRAGSSCPRPRNTAVVRSIAPPPAPKKGTAPFLRPA
jgi:hypothetical protein